MTAWQSQAPWSMLRCRAALLAEVRVFFARRDVLEVETPLLCRSTVTDLHLDSLGVQLGDGRTGYLQTSPEFAMKRLLAMGSGPIYQLCKAFRRDENGQRHNPEFSMLEWYRPGFSEQDLMDEVEDLLRAVLPRKCLPGSSIVRLSYRELFKHHLDTDPWTASDEALQALARQHACAEDLALSRDDALNLLMSHAIEPDLQDAVFVYDFPASQAALASVAHDQAGYAVARRFELFVKGMELANGYLELTDPDEQAARFKADNVQRRERGLPQIPPDERLVAALRHGLPACAGVALGFDRLAMLAAGASHISQVISFDADHA